MPTVNQVLAEICEEHAPDAPAIREGGADVVRGWLVRDGRRHFLSFRMHHRLWIADAPEGEGADVEGPVHEALLQGARADAAIFQAVNTEFGRLRQVVNGRGQSLADIEAALAAHRAHRAKGLGRYEPRRNRAEFLWTILWSIAAQDTSWLGNQGAKTEIERLIERRLWKLERMRYRADSNVSPDDFEMFKYPLGSIDPNVREVVELGGQSADFWQLGAFPEFVLKPGVDPVAAIRSFFLLPAGAAKWDSTIVTRTYCDKLIHTLHLEEMVEHLCRVMPDEAAVTAFLRGEIDQDSAVQRFAIVSSFNHTGGVGPNNEAIRNSLGGGGPKDDDYFERKTIRVDEVVPGDHFILRTHMAHYGLSNLSWGMENGMFTGFTDRAPTVAPCFPRDLEVQGHGIGPCRFGQMQQSLVGGVALNLSSAQAVVHSKDLLAKARSATTPTLPAGNTPPPYDVPFQYVREGTFGGAIEFRTEIARAARNPALDLTAFWARWVVRNPMTTTQGGGVDLGWAALELSRDTIVSPRDFNAPFISGLDFDEAGGVLTLEGERLTPNHVASVSFVSEPQRTLLPNGAYTSPTSIPLDPAIDLALQLDADPSVLPFLAVFDSQGTSQRFPPDDAFSADGTRLRLELPPTFSSRTRYWQPVLRSRLTELGVAVEIRASNAFRWPRPSPAAAVLYNSETIGGGDYNVGYVQLFERDPDNPFVARETRFIGSYELTAGLMNFYRETEPSETIEVIRPKMPAWFGQFKKP